MDFENILTIIDKGTAFAFLLYAWWVDRRRLMLLSDYIRKEHEKMSDDLRDFQKKKSDWPHSP